MICLPKTVTDKLKTALTNGDLPLEKLIEMSDREAHTMLAHYVGDEFATVINAELEKAKVSEQANALEKWVQKTFDPKRPELKERAIEKIRKVEKYLTPEEGEDFMRDLVTTKLGIDITPEQANKVGELFTKMEEKKAAIDRSSEQGSESRLDYGMALVELKDLVGELGMKSKQMTFAKYKKLPFGKKLTEPVYLAGGAVKSILSSFDNSFFGRQGIKTLYTHPTVWIKDFAKSFPDIAKQVVSKAPKGILSPQSNVVMDAIRADIYSRENALNGKYSAARNGYGLGVDTEEAFPVAFPERIPILGRLFKASEAAFNGGALRMRADLADAIIKSAEGNGIDMLDREEASSHAKLVTSMTGRGDIGKLDTFGREINALAFSIKFLKSNFDTLTAHQLDSTMTPAAKKRAAFNLLKIVASVAGILLIAKAIDPDSVDFDPTSSAFGKIKFKNHTFDITGGMGAIVTLAARLIMGKTKSASGKVTDLTSGKFGMPTRKDAIYNFFEGKTAPLISALRDYLEGKDFQGNKPTVTSTVSNLITPLPLNTYNQLQDPTNADGLATLIGEFLGLSTGQIERTQTEQQKQGEGNLIDLSIAYAKAFGIDPGNALKAMFTPEQLGKVKGNLVELQRFYGKEFDAAGGSEAYVKKQLTKMGIPWSERDKYNLEHIVPVAAGGDNGAGNLQLIDRDLHNSYTAFDTALAKSVQDGKMTRKEAADLSEQLKVAKILTVDQAIAEIRR